MRQKKESRMDKSRKHMILVYIRVVKVNKFIDLKYLGNEATKHW